ncbi:MAG: zinc ribbon domain-containing protein [Bacilli bacterium]|nr:zinc ribbon domain-containing protein [Bacilli bacterium]
MALINCPECGEKVSDTCDVCIHCGYRLKKPLQKPVENKENEKIVVRRGAAGGIIAVVIVDLVLGASFLFGGLLGIIFTIPNSKYTVLIILFSFFLVFGAFVVAAGIFGFVRIGQNARNINPCLVYDPETEKITAYALPGGSFEISKSDFLYYKCSPFSSDNILIIYYLDAAKIKRKARIGYVTDRYQLRNQIDTIINH